VTATEQFIGVLSNLKTGELGLLRAHAGQGLDESVDGFDLFAGLWWPLRQQKGGPPPRREVSWLIAKLYAFCPMPQSPGETLALRLRQCQPRKDPARARFQQSFDRILMLPLDKIEPALQWALEQVASNCEKLDWVQLAKDLSSWERETTRLEWAEQFLGNE
jgi:CRISPR type I-E-associated protein CasB/Cse2